MYVRFSRCTGSMVIRSARSQSAAFSHGSNGNMAFSMREHPSLRVIAPTPSKPQRNRNLSVPARTIVKTPQHPQPGASASTTAGGAPVTETKPASHPLNSSYCQHRRPSKLQSVSRRSNDRDNYNHAGGRRNHGRRYKSLGGAAGAGYDPSSLADFGSRRIADAALPGTPSRVLR
jgi:hypothetical protein